MKAEHRKELHTNLLADRMGRLVQGVKSGSGPKSAGTWIIAIIVVGLFVAWYFAKGSMRNESAAWVRLNSAGESTLRSIAVEYPGTIPGRTARFQQARFALRQGLDRLYGFGRNEALDNLEKAAKGFGELIAECSGEPLLQQEAMMGAAKAEEGRLVGISKQDDAKKFEDQFDKALGLYERLAREYPDSYLGQEAKRHAAELVDNRTKVLDFYAELSKLSKPTTPAVPPTPTAPAGGEAK